MQDPSRKAWQDARAEVPTWNARGQIRRFDSEQRQYQEAEGP
jgi:hypothetical protein